MPSAARSNCWPAAACRWAASSAFRTAATRPKSNASRPSKPAARAPPEIDMVINVGKALGGDWQYVEADVRAVCDAAHRAGAKVKVIFEKRLPGQGRGRPVERRAKGQTVPALRTGGRDWVKTSTGYGFVKQPDGSYNYQGATEHDLALMRASCSSASRSKRRGASAISDGLIRVRQLGATHAAPRPPPPCSTNSAVAKRPARPRPARPPPAGSAREVTESAELTHRLTWLFGAI